jgi:P27 family predicted phage terminase small subunit
MRGRKRKPPKLKLIAGNPGKRPIPGAPRPAAEVPAPYEWMSAEAKREWVRVAPQMAALGLLTVLDTDALALYCETISNYINAKMILEREGTTYKHKGLTKKHPCVGMRDQAARDAAMFARELGLLPTARQRLGVEDDVDEADPLAEFLESPNGDSAPSA